MGEFTISQQREIEDGQRVKVTLKVGVTLFQRSYGDNYSLVQALMSALATQEAVLQWTNTDNGTNYINQTVTQVSNDLPEEWGTYQMQFNLVFFYYEQNLVTNNLPLTYAGGGAVLTLGNVSKFSQVINTDRFSTYHSQRKVVKGKLTVTGYLLGDPTLALDQRRTALLAAKAAMDTALNGSVDGLLQFGAQGSVFNGTVRPEEYSSEIDELKYQIGWSFTASYTVFPKEATFATVEYSAEQRDANTGEQWLMLTGKITAFTEATARTQLAAVITAATTQYGFNVQSQQLRNDSKADLVQANGDGNAFIELSFTVEYRRFRSDNLQLTFVATKNKKQIPFGNTVHFAQEYSARRFNELRSQRSMAGGRVTASGTWLGDAKLTLTALRTALIAQQTAMLNEVNNADGTLTYGAFSQVGRVENLKAEINQALTGIDWSFTMIYSLFPNESGYATADYVSDVTTNIETGDTMLGFSGTILAPDEALAIAKLGTVRTSVLTLYGFNISQQLEANQKSRRVFANGDKTATIASLEAADGTTFIELSFSESYRQRMASLLGFKLQQGSKQDVTSGMIMTTYSGTVSAGGSSADAAYTAALVKAQALGLGREPQLGPGAFLKSSQVTWDQRQTQAANNIEFVSLSFAYEYQSRMPAGNAYVEMSTDWTTETFGNDAVSVSGSVIATTNLAAKGLYESTVKSVYAGMIITGESLRYATLTANADSNSPAAQDVRFDFSFSAFVPKAVGKVAYRYGLTTSNDYLQLQRESRVQGTVYALDVATATAAVATLLATLNLGSLVADSSGVDREYTSDSTLDVFLKYDFEARYVAKITGIGNLLEMKVTESVKYSGTRWITQSVPRAPDGTGGVSIVQDGGLEPGSRQVRGEVSAATKATAIAWARQQRALLTGDNSGGSYPQPEELDVAYGFLPRVDGVIVGVGENVQIYKVSFGFSEILPNYLPGT